MKNNVGATRWRISIKHLERYIAEFTYRYNYRDFDLFRLVLARLLSDGAMPYRKLVAPEPAE